MSDLSDQVDTYSKSLFDELREVDDEVLAQSSFTSADDQSEYPYIDYSVCSPMDTATSFGDMQSNELPPVVEPNNVTADTVVSAMTLPDVDDSFSCLICKDLLCEPIVLLCQHAYCYECLKDFHKTKTKQLTDYWEPVPMGGTDAGNRCPCCKFPFTVPPKYNHEYEQAIEKMYPDQYQQRKSEVRLKEKKDKLIEQMRREVWNMISEKPPTVNDIPYGASRDYVARLTALQVGRRFAVNGLVGPDADTDDIYQDIPYRSVEEQKQDRKYVSAIWGWTKFVITNPLVLTMGAVYLTKRMGMI